MAAVLFFVFLILAMWVAVVMPQQRRQRAHRQLVATLKEGDDVMTTAGVYGTIVAIDDDIVRLEIAPGVVVRIARQAILRPVSADEPDRALDERADDGDLADLNDDND
jgi:preprotein translocase subunit YajC